MNFRINWIANFRIESNEFQTNPISENVTPPYDWSRIEGIKFELIFTEFFNVFSLFVSIESNKFWTNSNLTPPLVYELMNWLYSDPNNEWTKGLFQYKTTSFCFFTESHWVDSVISALAKILLRSSFTTLITIRVKKYL